MPEGGLGLWIDGERIEPGAAGLVVDACRPRTARRVYFVLVAVYAPLVVALLTFAAKLYTRVDAISDTEVELQNEVAVVLCCAEERVGRTIFRMPYDSSVLDLVNSCSIKFLPPFEVLAVEERGPVLCAGWHG